MRRKSKDLKVEEPKEKSRVFFLAGTDTGVGKTMAVLALASLLREKGASVGVFKPVQSGVGDAEFLKRHLGLEDDLREINPYFAPEPLSPHLAFRRQGVRVRIPRIKKALDVIRSRYDIVLVEGAGGLLVPIVGNYLMADLARDIDADLVLVSRLGLGTINHSLLTVNEARRRGLRVAGVLFSDAGGKRGLSEKTNPRAVRELSGVAVLGTVPHLTRFDERSVCVNSRRMIDVRPLWGRVLPPAAPRSSSAKGLWATRGPASGVTRPDLLARWDKQYVWHPFTQMKDWVAGEPLVIDRGEGSYLIDAQGRRYLDGVSSLWVTVHGHRKRELDEALKAQAGKIAHSTMLGLSNTPAIGLAKRLIEIAPRGLEKVFYSDNGSTSVEIAVKMAYQYWQNIGRTRKIGIAHLANSYHGDTLGSVSIGGIDLFHKVYRKLIFRTIRVEMPDGYRDQDWAGALDRFERMVERDHAKIAALVVEPIVQGAAGMIMWPKGILKRFEMICRRHDIFLICDEVATGFGRTGRMFACEHENVRPDFLCMAKGITGGYLPLAVTLTTRRVFDGFVFPYEDMKTFFHGHTYTGNPLACAVALRNIELFKEERVIERLQSKIKFLASELQCLKTLSCVGDIRQRGFMVGVELVRDKRTKEPFPWEGRVGARVCEKARDFGVILRPLGNVIVLMPPLSITRQEIRLLINALERAITAIIPEMKEVDG
ncbi:MAG: adenosylmethionine--8-amino-7-oxononanoate transaminase [Elusimicrobia bacterium]|nr:adenosylmethionine--8-amino-7-oxononanoate transaminase [Elusimicrobiota bacterium]